MRTHDSPRKGTDVMNFSKPWNLVLVIVLCGVVAMLTNVSRAKSASGVEANTPQDVNSLDRRISMLEQRFYSLESSMNRLQQYVASRPSTTTSQPGVSDREFNVIRDEMQRLGVRLGEVECGLVKLDERTGRRGGTRSTDPCRISPETPLRLPTRP